MVKPRVALAAFVFAGLGVAITQLVELAFVESGVLRAGINGLFVGTTTYVGMKTVERTGSAE